MGWIGTSNKNVFNAVQDGQQQNFKTVNNLLTLQDNHVEEFFQYHGEAFLSISSFSVLGVPAGSQGKIAAFCNITLTI